MGDTAVEVCSACSAAPKEFQVAPVLHRHMLTTATIRWIRQGRRWRKITPHSKTTAGLLLETSSVSALVTATTMDTAVEVCSACSAAPKEFQVAPVLHRHMLTTYDPLDQAREEMAKDHSSL